VPSPHFLVASSAEETDLWKLYHYDVGRSVNGMKVSAKLREHYARYYKGESCWRAIGAAGKVKNIVNLCSAIPHDAILEIGSGEGSILQRLADLKFGSDLFSLEISESAVEVIRARRIPAIRNCQRFDGYFIPYEDGRFDLAVLSHVLEHVEYPRRLLFEAARVARYVFVEVPLEDTARLAENFVFDSVGHINFYSRKTIRRLVQTCDLHVLSQVVANPDLAVYRYQCGLRGVPKYWAKEVLLRTYPRLGCRLFTYHCAILCQRNTSHDT
jgi:SAM-dependent methyltransferase